MSGRVKICWCEEKNPIFACGVRSDVSRETAFLTFFSFSFWLGGFYHSILIIEKFIDHFHYFLRG